MSRQKLFLVVGLIPFCFSCAGSPTHPESTLSVPSKTYFERYNDDIEEAKLSETLSVYKKTDVLFGSNYIYIKSTAIEKVTIKYQGLYVLRESNGAKYDLFPSSKRELSLQCDIEDHFDFSYTLPTSESSEKYTLYFKVNEKEIRWHLYEKPDELRTVHKLIYQVRGNVVHEGMVLDGREIKPSFEYFESDRQSYAKSWSVVQGETQNGKAYSDIILNGNISSCFDVRMDYQTLTLWSINYVPSDFIVQFPKVAAIWENVFTSRTTEIHEVYIPKEVSKIYWFHYSDAEHFGRWKGCKRVHYEGTKEAWDNAVKNSSGYEFIVPQGITIDYNTPSPYLK